MDWASTYMLEFKAMLSDVVTESLSDIASINRDFPKANFTSNERAYQSRINETNRYLKKHHRHVVYLTTVSYKFVEKFPFIKDIDALDISDFDKLIIMMTIVGIPPKEIAHMLHTDVGSVKTIKHRREDLISEVMRRQAAGRFISNGGS